MTEELTTKIERFTKELNDANVAFVLVVSVSGFTPRWWTNLQRYTGGAIDSVKQALNQCGNHVANLRASRSKRIVTPRV